MQIGLYNCKEVAIKELNFDLNFNPNQLISLLKEISIMSYCNHKHIGNILAIILIQKTQKYELFNQNFTKHYR